MEKRERDLRRSITECAKHNARMVSFERTGSGHFMARVEAADGRKFALTCAFSPSSQSTIHMQQKHLRKLLTGDTK
jgi:hypothetical protein